MNRRNVILVGLGVLELLVAAAAYVCEESLDAYWIRIACDSIVSAQPYLVAIWIAFGERTLPWRLVTVAACLVCLDHCPESAIVITSDAIAVYSPGIVPVLGPLLLARTLGLGFYDASTTMPSNNSTSFQFSLRRMLEWTAAIAVLCSLGAMVSPVILRILSEVFASSGLLLCLFHGQLAATVLACVIAVLAVRRVWLGLAFVVPFGLFLAYLLHQPQYCTAWKAIEFSACLMTWITFCLLPVRHFGYRYGRPPRLAADAEPGNCPFQEPSDPACEVAP